MAAVAAFAPDAQPAHVEAYVVEEDQNPVEGQIDQAMSRFNG